MYRIKASSAMLAFLMLLATASPLPALADRTDTGAVTTLSAGKETAVATTLYVKSGAVGGTGSQKKPFGTLQEARDYIRAHPDDKLGGITVQVAKGLYQMDEPLQLEAQDSGTAASLITYRGEPGTILANGTVIASGSWKPLDDKAVARLSPQMKSEKVYQLDIRSLGLLNTEGFTGNASVEKWGLPDLIVGDTPQPISQWPNPNQSAGSERTGWSTANGSASAKAFYYGSGGKPEDGITADELNKDTPDRAVRWQKAVRDGRALYLQGFWRTDFVPILSKVSAVDPALHTITLAEAPSASEGMGSKQSAAVPNSNPKYNVGSGKEEWRALNVLEEIDVRGEWALDAKDGMLYYYPSTSLSDKRVVLANQKKPLITMQNTAYVNIVGFTLQESMDTAITLNKTNHITLAGNTIRNSIEGIYDNNGNDNVIQSNDIYDMIGKGIQIAKAGKLPDTYTADKVLVPGKTIKLEPEPYTFQVLNNHIHHIGRHIEYPALQIRDSNAVLVEHNLLHDTPRDALRYERDTNMTIQYNEVHNSALIETDTGAFYTANDWSSYGNLLQYNYIHHAKNSNGFYADQGDSGDTYRKNVIQGTKWAFLLNGHHNVASDNLIVDSHGIQIYDMSGSGETLLNSARKRLEDKIALEGSAWTAFGKKLAPNYGYNEAEAGTFWSGILDPAWHPEFSNGTRIEQNVLVNTPKTYTPKKGSFFMGDNDNITVATPAKVEDHLASIGLTAVFPLIGLQKDAYRTKVVSRADTGGLSDHY
ncbi:right-handed parallel beta-helix repeat-containing protein [Saccharibacillus sacchari]|uniref:Right-handed parallel beta-helix repeat-containing protein n=1 Tax=Saccharibacillus sacchari TaxID=456493 RepID=A0ACC6P5V8_9BACL